MKKLNEGPTIKTDHKGSHLTNADGEVVQSFAKDRAGLKAARQSMYKNYKGLNMKNLNLNHKSQLKKIQQ